MLFRRGERTLDHLIKLEQLFATKFPFGRGGLNEKRATKVSKSECLRHYIRIALPNFQAADFLLVICSLYQRLQSFQRCILSCNSLHDPKTLGEKLSQVTGKDIETAAKNILDGKETKNTTLK